MGDGGKFSCEHCGRSFVWKPHIAGKRTTCKCGNPISVPTELPEPEIDENALYDLAESEAEAAKSSPSLHRVVESPDPEAKPRRENTGRSIPRGAAAMAIPYRGGPTAAERKTGDRFATSNLMDMQRDLYVPIGLLLVGLALYVGYYAVHYHLSAGGVIAVTLALGLIAAIKAALLVGFALLIANPLGVSFGGIWTAALKLAAVAVFSDGVTSLVDGFVNKIAGSSFTGFSGYSAISLPVALGIYWVLLIYLFSMDAGDSWMVVILLSVFDYIAHTALMIILLNLVLGMGGVSQAALPVIGSASTATASPQTLQVEDLKDRNLLMPAQKIFDSGRQDVARGAVIEWTKAGAKNMWFEVNRDFSGHTDPVSIVIEMPDGKSSRKKIFDIMKTFYDDIQDPATPGELVDDGEKYHIVRIR